MKSVNENVYFIFYIGMECRMSHHFLMWQKQNITIHVLLFSELTAAKWKLACLRYCTIHRQQTSAGSTTGFEFVNVCREEMSSSSLNHSVPKLIAITWKNQTWRRVVYLFESRVWDRGLNSVKGMYSCI